MRSAAGLTAYILHSWDWSESSLILDAFTLEQGRIALVAKGAKRPSSGFRPVLLPLQRLSATPSAATAALSLLTCWCLLSKP